jgi:hypothetical protein
LGASAFLAGADWPGVAGGRPAVGKKKNKHFLAKSRNSHYAVKQMGKRIERWRDEGGREDMGGRKKGFKSPGTH